MYYKRRIYLTGTNVSARGVHVPTVAQVPVNGTSAGLGGAKAFWSHPFDPFAQYNILGLYFQFKILC